ncbi:MAG: (2Fe-2S)-binding protein [bacterium]
MKKRPPTKGRRSGAGGRRPAARPPTVVCRCEDVTEEEIRQVVRQGYDSLEAVKRALRTGMGHCQGRGCLRTIARLIEEETGRPAADQQWPRSRPPLKPLPLGMLGDAESDEPDR